MARQTHAVICAIGLLCLIASPDAGFAQIGAAAERAAGRAAVSAAEQQAAERAAKEAAGAASRRAASKAADRVVRRWTAAMCKPSAPCPLPERIANTFVGGSYDEIVLGEGALLYRAFHDPKFKFGDPGQRFSFWTRSNGKGTQAMLDSAIPVSQSGNTAERIVAVRVPKGTRVYEGQTQSIERGPVGGGNQVVIEDARQDWEISITQPR